MSERIRQVLVAGVAVAVASGALAKSRPQLNADRPGIADGSKVVGNGHVQLEVGVQKEFRLSDHRAMAPLLVRAGIGQNWEFRLETNSYVSLRARDGLRRRRWRACRTGAGSFRLRTQRTARRLPRRHCPAHASVGLRQPQPTHERRP
jgi:opacity protein-like surface antigen